MEVIMAEAGGLQLVHDQGWRIGFVNLMRREISRRFSMRNWLIQGVIWLALLNLVLALVLEAEEAGQTMTAGVTAFILATSILAPIGMVVAAHGAIINEKRAGTAAWVLSKPASRIAFILSKFITIGVGFIVIVIILQGIIAYAQLSVFQGSPIPALPFLGALFLLALNVIFYLALTLFLGTVFEARIPVLGIPIALIIGQVFLLAFLGNVADWLPNLFPGSLSDMAVQAALGSSLPSPWILPIFITISLTTFLIYLTILRFRNQEF
jgi:ABC-2 type transport system permease protein